MLRNWLSCRFDVDTYTLPVLVGLARLSEPSCTYTCTNPAFCAKPHSVQTQLELANCADSHSG
jgi:hypothetical protein